MAQHALAARHPDGRLKLFLRVVRAPSGVYVVFAAGQHRPEIAGKSYNPHVSWHRDGRVHQKSYGRRWLRQQRQRLDAFRGSEPLVATSVDQMPGVGLPQCNPNEFASVMEVPVCILDVAPGRQQVHVDLVAPDSLPRAVGFGERPLLRWWLSDAAPSIVVSLYEFALLAQSDGIM